ncbi:hypothetical protein IF188_00680 [Microbacterium sp. NEAU-LLC]|uniref:Transcriptional regulator, AbiEi antitoxin, Type IV TA system n=1 Tax=Microbacterium helvum TaxID=2773713 RepID=A0ABR8NJW4_9MICO|nr:hypothetical protein [Microbacterium helvum]MBD3940213.1 hypothetical protein [Microbacterium helvum]
MKDADWDPLWPESRHRIQVAAAFAEMRGGDSVASYDSAAVVWELPLYRCTPEVVHVTVPDGKHISSRNGMRRHGDALADKDVTVREGIRVTTLERTVLDLACTLPFAAGLAAADAALRLVACDDGAYDEAGAQTWRDEMLARVAGGVGRRGVRTAAEVLALADGRAESPAESAGRGHLHRLGFRRLRPQVEVRGPDGRVLRVDVEIEDIATFLEIDGAGKYLDEALRTGRTVEQVILDEKRREDWIRGTTGKRMVRVDEKHVRTAEALAARLSSFGISLPR